jgi:hypothetical protein
MKTIITTIVAVVLGLSTAFAQNSNNDPQESINNYKHPNKAKKAASIDNRAHLKSDKVALRSQRTNKTTTRDYVLAPANSSVATNVQGQKTKANYKSQF